MTFATSVRSFLLAVATVAGAHAAEVAANMLLLDGALAGPAVVAVGERGAILRSTDAGRTWSAADSGATATLTGVSFAADGLHGWAVGHDALILATADGGLTWRKAWQGENLQDSFLDVLALDARHILAIGAYGLMMESADGGRTWNRRKLSGDDFHFNRLTQGPTGTLYLAGERGTLLRSRDRAITWERIDSPYDGSFYGILPLGPELLVAYGLRGRVYRSVDDGNTWAIVPNDQRVLIATGAQVKPGVLVFAGQSRALFISRDSGVTLALWPVDFTAGIAELIALPGGSVLALGAAGATVLPAP